MTTNQVQDQLVNILREFIEICDQLDLRYFMVCGSALGAVKYNGFIPWDDDIDVALFRDDYEFFCKNAPALLKEKYFLQNYKTDPAFPAIYSKLRDSTTTCIEKSVATISINHGLGIDIFPLDGYPVRTLDKYWLEVRKKIYSRILSVPCIRDEKWKNAVVQPLRTLGVGKHTNDIANAYTKVITKWKIENSDVVANHGNWQGKLEYSQKEIYGEGKMVFFEGIQVRVPQNYDVYLKQKYGNYQKDPPEDKKVSHHKYLCVDLNKSYKEYFKRGGI